MKPKKNKHAQALGKIKSAKKAAASRENGKKGGRKPKALFKVQIETDGLTPPVAISDDWKTKAKHFDTLTVRT